MPCLSCKRRGLAGGLGSEYKQMASKPTRTAKGWPLGPVKKYKDICHSYKLTSGPVVLRRVTTARRSGGTVRQTIPIGWCVEEHHHHQTQPPLLSCFTHSSIFLAHTHSDMHAHTQHTSSSCRTQPQIKAVHFTKIKRGRRPQSAGRH